MIPCAFHIGMAGGRNSIYPTDGLLAWFDAELNDGIGKPFNSAYSGVGIRECVSGDFYEFPQIIYDSAKKTFKNTTLNTSLTYGCGVTLNVGDPLTLIVYAKDVIGRGTTLDTCISYGGSNIAASTIATTSVGIRFTDGLVYRYGGFPSEVSPSGNSNYTLAVVGRCGETPTLSVNGQVVVVKTSSYKDGSFTAVDTVSFLKHGLLRNTNECSVAMVYRRMLTDAELTAIHETNVLRFGVG